MPLNKETEPNGRTSMSFHLFMYIFYVPQSQDLF